MHYLTSTIQEVPRYCNIILDKSLTVANALRSKINLTAITTIVQFGIIFGLYLLHPHIFTWTAVLTFFFLNAHVIEAQNKVNNLFVNFINNPKFPLYARVPIAIGAGLVLLHNIPDWMNIATFYFAAKVGAKVHELAEGRKLSDGMIIPS